MESINYFNSLLVGLIVVCYFAILFTSLFSFKGIFIIYNCDNTSMMESCIAMQKNVYCWLLMLCKVCCNKNSAVIITMFIITITQMIFDLVAEYGDYDSNEHKEDFIEEYQLLPTVIELRWNLQ